jgi:hypothetical protein
MNNRWAGVPPRRVASTIVVGRPATDGPDSTRSGQRWSARGVAARYATSALDHPIPFSK